MLLVNVLFALLTFTTVQFTNGCNCGNPACCQNPYFSGSQYNVFNYGHDQQYGYWQQYGSILPDGYGQQYGYGQEYGSILPEGYGQQYGIGQQFGFNVRPNFAKTPCFQIDPVPIPLFKVFLDQPVFLRVVDNSADMRRIDNICTTVFPLSDDKSSFLVYDSTVYCDGSNSVRTTVCEDFGTGSYIRGNSHFSIAQRVFAALENDMYIGCTQEVFGDSKTTSVFATSLGRVTPLGGSLQQIRSIIQCVGQEDENGLHVLPYRLPTRCVTQQFCSLTNPLLD